MSRYRMLRKLVAIAILHQIGGCSDACENVRIGRSEAPGGRHGAVLFRRGCVVTTGVSTQVAVLPAGERASGPGNALRIDDDHGTASAAAWGGPWAEVTWLAADHLLVSYDAKARVFARPDEVAGVRVTYRKVDR